MLFRKWFALTGTPGTGKTSVTNAITKMYNGKRYHILDINRIVEENNFISSWDDIRETMNVNMPALRSYIKMLYARGIEDRYCKISNQIHENVMWENRCVILEGHFSHKIVPDIVEKVIILRCHPHILEKRLLAKGYKHHKIRENMEAEAIDIITVESVELYGEDRVCEVDTTTINVGECAETVIAIIENKHSGLPPGTIDWSEVILEWY